MRPSCPSLVGYGRGWRRWDGWRRGGGGVGTGRVHLCLVGIACAMAVADNHRNCHSAPSRGTRGHGSGLAVACTRVARCAVVSGWAAPRGTTELRAGVACGAPCSCRKRNYFLHYLIVGTALATVFRPRHETQCRWSCCRGLYDAPPCSTRDSASPSVRAFLLLPLRLPHPAS